MDPQLERYLTGRGGASAACQVSESAWARNCKRLCVMGGLYMPDAKGIWSKVAKDIVDVDVEGTGAGILESDLDVLEKAEIEEPVVRLVPYFDSFLLGHKSHGNIVDEKNRKKIYRAQGWVSPVLLVDGRAQGVWSHVQKKNDPAVRVSPFSKLSVQVSQLARKEAADLGRFLGCENVKTTIA